MSEGSKLSKSVSMLPIANDSMLGGSCTEGGDDITSCFTESCCSICKGAIVPFNLCY